MCNGLCPRCLYIRELTRHHIFPRRFFGDWKNSPIMFLCRTCHDKIEKLIPENEKLHKDDYLQIAREFLTQN
jgi:5-methylcytosine-specific restriction endonuclease McrA